MRQGTFDVPDDFDAATSVMTGLARTPWRYRVSLLVRASTTHIRTRFPVGIATVQELNDDTGPVVDPAAADDDARWVRVRLRAERLDWLPPLLVSLDSPFVIEQPDELRDLISAFAARLDRWAAAVPRLPRR